MRIIAYRLSDKSTVPQPAQAKRDWMDVWPAKHPYHCLPVVVANCYGWTMKCENSFEATWNGGSAIDSVTVYPSGNRRSNPVVSRIGNGILSFLSGCIIRTELPYQLFLTGPLNTPKDGLHALSAILETSWAPSVLNMNYQFTRPTTVRFEKGEPFCQMFPIVPEAVEVDTEVRDVTPDTQLYHIRQEWRLQRRLAREGIELADGTVLGRQKGEKRRYHHVYHRAVRPNGEPLSTAPRRYVAQPFGSPNASQCPHLQLADEGDVAQD
jgi:hypothetical protein